MGVGARLELPVSLRRRARPCVRALRGAARRRAVQKCLKSVHKLLEAQPILSQTKKRPPAPGVLKINKCAGSEACTDQIQRPGQRRPQPHLTKRKMNTCCQTTVPMNCSYEDEVDAFKFGSREKIPYSFKNIFNDTLTPYPEKSYAAFHNSESEEETDGSQPRFFLKMYRALAGHTKGLAVAITVQKNNKNYIVSVNSDSSITLEQRELPQDIPAKESEIIFYQKVFCTEHPNAFRYESSLKQNFYLGFRKDDCNKRLVLKYCPTDELDETIKFILEDG